MGLLDFFSARNAPRKIDEIAEQIDGRLPIAGRGVSQSDAMGVATVMACVKVISDGVATPELMIYRETEDGRRVVARDVPLFRVLNRRPNQWQTSMEFRRTMTMHAALTGNALAIKTRVRGEVRELIPVPPENFEIRRNSRYEMEFRAYDEFGLIGVFGEKDVFHLPCWQWDAIKGLDAVRMARSAIGLSISAERNQEALHENGGRPAGILGTEQKLSPEAIDRLRGAWRNFLATNKNGTAILDSGMKYYPMAMSGVDAQHQETRRMQVEEIARAFGVFPIMIGHSDKTATFASSEAFFAAHVKHTLTPWWQLWKQRLDEFVMDGAGPLFADFDSRYLLAGSMRDRAVWARTMAELGIYTRNELRDEEGKDPIPGLDDPLTPLNMASGGEGEDDEADA
jgi:HK97 family phage portal protein